MNQGVKDLIEISKAYGSRKEYVIAGGGNTSFKTEDKLWIKASGFALSTISEEGFAVMNRKKLDKISENEYSSNPFERESQIKDDLADATITKDKRPSVETSFHNAINYKFVVHLHPTAVNGIMCSNKAEELVKPVFGDEAVYIPYIDPGYILFKAVEAKIIAFREKKGYDPKVILLQNHGIFVSADTTQEIIDIYDEIIANIEKAVTTPVDETILKVAEHVTKVVPAIRAIVSQDGLKTIKVTNSALVEKFNASAEAFEKVNYPLHSRPDRLLQIKIHLC